MIIKKILCHIQDDIHQSLSLKSFIFMFVIFKLHIRFSKTHLGLQHRTILSLFGVIFVSFYKYSIYKF